MSISTPPGASASNDLVPVFLGEIGDVQMHVCDARTLHAFLENGEEFAHWIKDRIKKYDFIENQDFAIAWGNSQAKRGGHNRKDYVLSLDMAKELAMVENNGKGRLARRYFIDCERRLRETGQPEATSQDAFPEALQAAIDRKALALTLRNHEHIRAILTKRVRYLLRQGDSQAEVVARLDQQALGAIRLVNAEDLLPLGASLANLANAVEALIEGRTEARPACR